jgi:hypothetical protein
VKPSSPYHAMRQRTTEGSRARVGRLLPLPGDATAEGSRVRVGRLLPLPHDATTEGSLGDAEDSARGNAEDGEDGGRHRAVSPSVGEGADAADGRTVRQRNVDAYTAFLKNSRDCWYGLALDHTVIWSFTGQINGCLFLMVHPW